jgi:predicted nucleic acid-binding protein
MIVISDTTAISNLIQIGALNLLKDIYNEIIIPTAVYNELLVLDSNELPVRKQLNQDWFKIETVIKDSTFLSLSVELDIGEVEAITLAIQKKADYLLIDEKEGRKIAVEKELKIIGTLGILIEAKRQKLIESVKTKMDDLMNIGFWINPKLYNKVIEIEQKL